MKIILDKFNDVLVKNYNSVFLTLNPGIQIESSPPDVVLPKEYFELMAWHNGQNTFFGDMGLTAHGSLMPYQSALETRNELLGIAHDVIVFQSDRDKWFNKMMWPLAINACSDMLCLNITDMKLYQYIHNDTLQYSGYSSLSDWIEIHVTTYLNRLVVINGGIIEFPSGIIIN